ncbi:ferric reductase like transmembrane component-domain-containing protein [Mrakia frigida]|uniref:ferric reductase family protein n=1 Tax=Mrakia frigida TaxID=29902 RepID=UPI003FCC0C4A
MGGYDVIYNGETAVQMFGSLGIDFDLSEYQDYYGPEMATSYATCYVAYWWSSFYVSDVFNFVLWGAVGLILLVGALRQITNRLITGRLPTPLRKFQTFVVKNIFLSSTFGTKALEPVSFIGAHGALGRWTSFQIPTRIHSLLVGTYVVANLIMIVAAYDVPRPNLLYQDLGYQFEAYARYASDRTAILAFGATPLVYVLASRNSPIAWFTGASYSTLQIYHRWVARIVYIHVFIHSVAWTVLEAIYSDEEIIYQFTSPYWNWGCVGTAACAVLVACSVRRIRELSYEAFLIGHIIANVFYIVGSYYHVWYIDPDYKYLKYIYAAIALWSADRFFRFVGLLYLNLAGRLFTKSSSKKQTLAAEGYLVGTGDFIRLRLTPSASWPALFRAGGPGSYVFISTPGFKIYESHPFTIAWPSHMSSPDHSSAGSSSDSDKQLALTSVTTFEETEIENEHSFELILKSYSGYTKRLAEELAGSDAVEYKEGVAFPVKKIKLLVEGPYGAGVRLEGFQSVILVAGGSGISATIVHLADLARRVNEPGYRVERISVVWAIRQTRACDVLIPYLLRLQHLFPRDVPSDFLTLNIYYTGETRQTLSLDEEKRSELHASSLAEIGSLFQPVSTSFASLHVRHGRPDIALHVEERIQYAEGTIALSACGPSGLCDVSREAVKARLGGKDGVDSDQLVYHEEAFTW